MTRTKIPGRTWFNFVLFGFIGQVAWAVENMFFNTFLYNGIYTKVTDQAALDSAMPVQTAISWMVGLSAIAAFISALLLGTLSDHLNRRKAFMCFGYITWGIVTACFGFISLDNTQRLLNTPDMVYVLTFTAWLVIIMDVLMTFTGAIGNDAGFNAWVTDVTDETNRPLSETILAVLPIAAMGVVLGLGAVVGKIGYPVFFFVLGASVTLCGLLGLFTIRESRSGIKTDSHYLRDLIYGFRPAVVREHANLYLVFAAVCIFNIAVQIFFPYIFIYLQHIVLPATVFDAKTIASAAIALVLMLAGIVLLLKNAEKIGRTRVFIFTTIGFIVGLFLVFFFGREAGSILLCMVPAIIGYAVLLILLGASARDYTPEDKAGQFQGVRMIFYVMLPMTVGPKIGDLVISRFSQNYYTNDYNVQTLLPTSEIFLFTALVSILVLVPIVALRIRSRKKAAA